MFNEYLRRSETNYMKAESSLIRVLQPNKEFFSSSPKAKTYDSKKLVLLSTMVNKILGVGNYPGFQNEEYERVTIHESADLIQANSGPILFVRRATYGEISVEIAEYLILLNKNSNQIIDIRYANAAKDFDVQDIDQGRKRIILELGKKNWTSLLDPGEEFKSVKNPKNKAQILKISTEILQHIQSSDKPQVAL